VAFNDVINVLTKFLHVDKYACFYEVLPSVASSPEDQRLAVSEILNRCCSELIAHFQQSKKPLKPVLRQSLIDCMDRLSIAQISAENREFGYQLGWFLADKVQVNLKTGTEKKIWGYWKVEDSIVRQPIRPRISPNAKPKTAPKSKSKKAQAGTELV